MANVKSFRSGIVLDPVSADPSGPSEGQLQVSDGTHRTAGLWQYLGAAWVQVPTSLTGSLTTKTGAYTLLTTDDTIIADATSAGFTLTLPTAASASAGKIYKIVKVDSTNNQVTIDGNGSETIDGSTTVYLDSQYQSVQIVSDGSNWFAVSGSTKIDSMIRLHTGNGHGSTNTKIRRFTTTIDDIGTAITYADSATNGATFTVNEDGVYHIHLQDGRFSSSSANVGLSLNSSQLTTDIPSITAADILGYTRADSGTASTQALSVSVVLSKDDVVRVHTDGNANLTGSSYFTMTKIGRI